MNKLHRNIAYTLTENTIKNYEKSENTLENNAITARLCEEGLCTCEEVKHDHNEIITDFGHIVTFRAKNVNYNIVSMF